MTRCLIMAKVPAPGQSKTRLGKEIGDENAASIAASMLRCVVRRWQLLCDVAIAVAPVDSIAEMAVVVGPPLPVLFDQHGVDLGDRIKQAWNHDATDATAPCVVLGMDSPDIPWPLMKQAVTRVATNDVVLGGTDDGGYWTLAMPRWQEVMVHNIQWGTDVVMEQSCQRAADANLRISRLPRWYDVDDLADLRSVRTRLDRLRCHPAEPEASRRHLAALANDIDTIGVL